MGNLPPFRLISWGYIRAAGHLLQEEINGTNVHDLKISVDVTQLSYQPALMSPVHTVAQERLELRRQVRRSK